MKTQLPIDWSVLAETRKDQLHVRIPESLKKDLKKEWKQFSLQLSFSDFIVLILKGRLK